MSSKIEWDYWDTIYIPCPSLPGFAIDKKELEQRYKEKFLVVLRNGLSAGVCSHSNRYQFRPVIVRVDGDRIEFDKQTGLMKMAAKLGADEIEGCGYFVPESLQPGDVLGVKADRSPLLVRGRNQGS